MKIGVRKALLYSPRAARNPESKGRKFLWTHYFTFRVQGEPPLRLRPAASV
jgi:hypothetical protein